MLGLAKRVGARFLLTSTSEVYGDPLQHPQAETYWGNVNPIGNPLPWLPMLCFSFSSISVPFTDCASCADRPSLRRCSELLRWRKAHGGDFDNGLPQRPWHWGFKFIFYWKVSLAKWLLENQNLQWWIGIGLGIFHFFLQVRIARIFNTYGPRMCIDDGRVVSNFVAQVRFLLMYYNGTWSRFLYSVRKLIFNSMLKLPCAYNPKAIKFCKQL